MLRLDVSMRCYSPTFELDSRSESSLPNKLVSNVSGKLVLDSKLDYFSEHPVIIRSVLDSHNSRCSDVFSANLNTCIPPVIQPDGSAAVSGIGLKVGQQILQVNSKSLQGLTHSETVSTIKAAFEGPINTTTITFIVLDPQ